MKAAKGNYFAALSTDETQGANFRILDRMFNRESNRPDKSKSENDTTLEQRWDATARRDRNSKRLHIELFSQDLGAGSCKGAYLPKAYLPFDNQVQLRSSSVFFNLVVQ
jgi:hypothetical protein